MARRARTWLGALAGAFLLLGLLGAACSSFGTDDAPPASAEGGDAPGPQMGDEGGAPSDYRRAVLDDAPIAYWRMGTKTGATVTDESGHENHLVLSGGYTLGAPGALASDRDSAIQFDGKTGVGMALKPRAFDFGSKAPFTVELWAKRDDLPSTFSYHYLVTDLQGSGTSRTGFDLQLVAKPKANEKAQTSFQYLAPGGNEADFGALVPVGQWAHYVNVFDGISMMLFIDGKSPAPVPVTGAMALSTGRLIVGGADGDDYFPGTIDEVAIYDKALQADRIAIHRSIGLR